MIFRISPKGPLTVQPKGKKVVPAGEAPSANMLMLEDNSGFWLWQEQPGDPITWPQP